MTSPNSAPVWPPALKDDTPLPFSAWRVLNLVDGNRTVAEIARELQLSHDQVAEALAQAQAWTHRAVQREQEVTDAMILTVSQCLMSVVGPVGEFIVDDALEDAGSHATLSKVLAQIAPQLSETHLHAFVRQLRAKGLA